MGGRGSGGKRPGTGPKPALTVVPDAVPTVPVVATFDPPSYLTDAEQTVWSVLGPLAVIRGTLTIDTVVAFELLCRTVVLERLIAATPEKAGTADHRGILQRAEALLLKFDLAPNGKPHQAIGKQTERPKSSLEQLKERRAAMRMVRGA